MNIMRGSSGSHITRLALFLRPEKCVNGEIILYDLLVYRRCVYVRVFLCVCVCVVVFMNDCQRTPACTRTCKCLI